MVVPPEDEVEPGHLLRQPDVVRGPHVGEGDHSLDRAAVTITPHHQYLYLAALLLPQLGGQGVGGRDVVLVLDLYRGHHR